MMMLRALGAERLRERWSPEQIAQRLKAEFPGRPEMQVSHETIYQSLYVQGRGALRGAGCVPADRAGAAPARRRTTPRAGAAE